MRTLRATSAPSILAVLALVGCSGRPIAQSAGVDAGVSDLAAPVGDDSGAGSDDAAWPQPPLNLCFDTDPGCLVITFGPPDAPFRLHTDTVDLKPRFDEQDDGLMRDANSYLALTGQSGSYSMILAGCYDDSNFLPAPTTWFGMSWDAVLPPATSIAVHVRSGPSPVPDKTWDPWSAESAVSPLDLYFLPIPKTYLEVEFLLGTKLPNSSPKLMAFHVGFKCPI